MKKETKKQMEKLKDFEIKGSLNGLTISEIHGGAATKTKNTTSQTTGWTCKDNSDGSDDGDYKPATVDERFA